MWRLLGIFQDQPSRTIAPWRPTRTTGTALNGETHCTHLHQHAAIKAKSVQSDLLTQAHHRLRFELRDLLPVCFPSAATPLRCRGRRRHLRLTTPSSFAFSSTLGTRLLHPSATPSTASLSSFLFTPTLFTILLTRPPFSFSYNRL